jgi:hypothetical protein
MECIHSDSTSDGLRRELQMAHQIIQYNHSNSLATYQRPPASTSSVIPIVHLLLLHVLNGSSMRLEILSGISDISPRDITWLTLFRIRCAEPGPERYWYTAENNSGARVVLSSQATDWSYLRLPDVTLPLPAGAYYLTNFSGFNCLDLNNGRAEPRTRVQA